MRLRTAPDLVTGYLGGYPNHQDSALVSLYCGEANPKRTAHLLYHRGFDACRKMAYPDSGAPSVERMAALDHKNQGGT